MLLFFEIVINNQLFLYFKKRKKLSFIIQN